MTERDVCAAYARSLAWVALMVAAACGTAYAVSAFSTFLRVHEGPPPPWTAALGVLIFQAPMIGFMAVIGSFLVFSIPQLFQALVVAALPQPRDTERRVGIAALLALPLSALLTWYCFDHLTPDASGSFLDADTVPIEPYRHGLTMYRYLVALAFQGPVTLFNVVYCVSGRDPRARRRIVVSCLAFASVLGAALGSYVVQRSFGAR